MANELSEYALLELDEAKRAIGASSTFSDEDTLIMYVNGVSELIENICGEQFLYREYTETFDGDGTNKHRVRHVPVLTGVSYDFDVIAEEDGTEIDSTTVKVNTLTGVFYLEEDVFEEGFQNCSITYYAGRTTVPQGVKTAAAITLAKLWKQKDKGFESVSSITLEGQTVTFDTGAVPPEALAMLAKYRRPRFA